MTDDRKLARESRPVILTKLDALMYAVERLERMAADCELTGIILDSIKNVPAGDYPVEQSTKLAELKQLMPEPALQAIALREGAKAIREMVLEERLVAARAAAHGTKVGPL